jgi:hypothetical protein
MSEKKSMPWYVIYEVREIGAIGEFAHSGLSAIADSEAGALAQVQQALNAKGYETRFPVKVFQYEENEQ